MADVESMAETGRYRRILLKISGELLGGAEGVGFDSATVNRIANELHEVANHGIEVGVVVGGGNFFRGGRESRLPISRVRGDQIGMLCTIINALALEQILHERGSIAVVQSAVFVPSLVESYDAMSFESYFADKRVVIFAGGTGNTHVTTDTAASLRAVEIGADILLKATKVDGVYSESPDINADAVKYDQLTFDEVLNKNLTVMDAMAVAVCRENNLPIRVFNACKEGSIARVGLGSDEGTLVSKET